MGSLGSVTISTTQALLALLVIAPAVAWHGMRSGASRWTVLLRVVAACYATTIAAMVFFPLPLPLPPWTVPTGGGDYRGWPYPWVSPVPFETIRASLALGWVWPAERMLIGNVVVFMPVGVLAPLLGRRWDSWRAMLGLGFAVSVGIELGQLGMSLLIGSPYRVADVDDVILNVLGVLLGYAALRTVRQLVARSGRATG